MEKENDESVASIIKQLNPRWNDIGDAFEWPPDLFHVCSYILKKTGAYRNVVREYSKIDHDKYFTEDSSAKVLEPWLEAIQGAMTDQIELQLPSGLLALKEELSTFCKKVNFNELRVLTSEDAKTLSNLLITCLALADHVCGGFGLPGKPGLKGTKKCLVYYVANLLLVTRGSLSSLPKFCGVIVPKMRTPQAGLTIRSFSLYLAFVESEVEIMWRSVPWVNLDQNTLNVLCVPWPKSIENIDFENRPDTFESVRYFSFNKKQNNNQSLESLIGMLKNVNEERCRIHLVIFPELSFEYSQYRSFLKRLKDEYEQKKLGCIPMVIGGITFAEKDYNAVVLAVYFSGKWYMMLQTKHHRWKLTRSQLIQYELAGTFSVEREWFEKIAIEQRRLSFFSPNAWLMLCPLVCEDLAQLEPVSEVIRAVGPSLLIALLMDGPQIKERWPARYASVFADDPGTAVLSLTSLGMLKRSKSLSQNQRNETSVGLWKDQVNGWANIEVLNSNSRSTALLTISASMKKEFSADGRNDNGYAPVFKLDNIFFPEEKEIANGNVLSEDLDNIWIGDWNDLKELTSVNFALDALLTSCGEHWNFITFLVNPSKVPSVLKTKVYTHLFNLLIESTLIPEQAGIDSFEEQKGDRKLKEKGVTPSLIWAIEEFDSWKSLLLKMQMEKMKVNFTNDNESIIFRLTYYKALLDKSIKDLESKSQTIKREFKGMNQKNRDKLRIKRAVPLAVLVSLHNRLDAHRTNYKRANHKFSPLFTKLEAALIKYLPFG